MFGKYDIRGIMSPTFNADTFHRLGWSFAHWMQQQGIAPDSWVAVGYDVRFSSPECSMALIQGLTECGINVLRLGMVPSPLAYFTECFSEDANAQLTWGLPDRMAGSLVVTASHNPPQYNGLKMTFQQLPLMPEAIQAVKQFFEQGDLAPLAVKPGRVMDWGVLPAYHAWLAATEGTFHQPLKIVVDCANAATSPYAPAVLSALGMNVIPLFAEPDGRFPNHHPDPCVPENLALLQQAVVQHQADLGVSYDGDGDRLGVVDSQGRIVPGDMLTLLLYWGMCMQADPTTLTVVSEVKCSRHLFDAIRARGSKTVLSLTGHSFMKRTVRQAKAQLAGELSGHVVFRDRHWGYDDAIYNTVRLLNYVLMYMDRHPGKTFTDWVDTLPQTALGPERRVPCTPEQRDDLLASLTDQIEKTRRFLDEPVERLETLDGIRIELPGGFCLIRGSNTEPCLTLRTEAADVSTLTTRDAALLSLVQGYLPDSVTASLVH
jgi:phosphomannomutase / phosphoglucomutase